MQKLKLLFLSGFINNNEVISMFNPTQIQYQTNQNLKIANNPENQITNVIKTLDNGENKVKELVWYNAFTYITFIGIAGVLLLTFLNFFINNTGSESHVLHDNTPCLATNFCAIGESIPCTTDADCIISALSYGVCNTIAGICGFRKPIACLADSNCLEMATTETSLKSVLGLCLQLGLGAISALSLWIKVGFSCKFASITKLIIIVYGIVLGALALSGELLDQSFLSGLTGNENKTGLGFAVSILDLGVSGVGLMTMVMYNCLHSSSDSYKPL